MLMDEQRQECRPRVGMDTHAQCGGRPHGPQPTSAPPLDLLFRAPKEDWAFLPESAKINSGPRLFLEA